jgi:hypothetical protein
MLAAPLRAGVNACHFRAGPKIEFRFASAKKKSAAPHAMVTPE